MNITSNISPQQFFVNHCNVISQHKAFMPAFKASPNSDVFEKTSGKKVETKYGTIYYTKDKFSHFAFKKPQSLSEALKTIKYLQDNYKLHSYGIATTGYVYSSFDKAFGKNFKDMRFVSYLGCGNTAMAIENEEGKVLKLSELNQFGFDRKTENFDAKVFERGKIAPCYYYYIQEKCSQDNITQKHVEEIKNKIEKAGYTPFDLSVEQVGIAKDGCTRLIDPECARDEKALEDAQKRYQEWMLKHGLDIDYI